MTTGTGFLIVARLFSFEAALLRIGWDYRGELALPRVTLVTSRFIKPGLFGYSVALPVGYVGLAGSSVFTTLVLLTRSLMRLLLRLVVAPPILELGLMLIEGLSNASASICVESLGLNVSVGIYCNFFLNVFFRSLLKPI